jgi:dTDP-4-amino-4,6-dideoxygalactose transaminase
MKPSAFPKPIYVTKPILPELGVFQSKLEEIWSTGWLTNNGNEHQKLEARLQQFLKVPELSLFNNGTIGLIVALQSLKLAGEVITTPFTFPATPHVLMWNRLTPVFCDIDPVTMNIDPKRIERLISPSTSAILGVHVYGTPCDVKAIGSIAEKYKLKVIYDAAHAFGTEINGTGIGNFGDVSMFSFHATKLFHTAEGGALSVKNAELKREIDLLKNFGINNEEEVLLPGINGKMNELQAALGLTVLDCYKSEWNKRNELFSVYSQRLNGVEGITVPVIDPQVTSSHQYFVIRIEENRFGRSRDEVHADLQEKNLFTRKYFYPLCSQYDCYKNLPSSDPANLPVATKISDEVLCLPFYGALSDDDVHKVCDLLLSMKR